MEKAHFSVEDERMDIKIPFAKVSSEERTVSGFATLDSLDTGNDIIVAEASESAWENFRGNVREQHTSLAAGKVVEYRPETYIDDLGKAFNGIWVKVYVSKGAESTWEKVVDGTLSGFSIGGNILECHTEYVPDLKKSVRFITRYEMVELSLVDSPANQLCNVLSVTKMANGTNKVDGIAVETEALNVLWCDNNRVAVATKEEARDCSICHKAMENVGWFERMNDEPDASHISKVLQNANKVDKELDTSKGGSENMPEEVEKEAVETVEEPKVTETQETVVTEPVVEATEVEKQEVAEVSEPSLETVTKALEEIKSALSKTADENALEDIRKSVTDVQADVSTRFEELLKQHNELSESVKSVKSELGGMEKKLDSLGETFEKSTAIKKSSDVTTPETVQTKDKGQFWSNAFLPDSQ